MSTPFPIRVAFPVYPSDAYAPPLRTASITDRRVIHGVISNCVCG